VLPLIWRDEIDVLSHCQTFATKTPQQQLLWISNSSNKCRAQCELWVMTWERGNEKGQKGRVREVPGTGRMNAGGILESASVLGRALLTFAHDPVQSTTVRDQRDILRPKP